MEKENIHFVVNYDTASRFRDALKQNGYDNASEFFREKMRELIHG